MPLIARTRRTLKGAAAVTVAALTLGVGPALPATAASQAEGTIENVGAPGAIKDRYIVVLGKGADADSLKGKALAAKYGAKVKRTYHTALNGYAVELTEKQAKRFAADPAVESVVQDQVVKVTGTDPTGTQPKPPSWGLDRIDQPALPLDSSYTYAGTAGGGVTAYIIDTGVRISHQDFGGRASYGFSALEGDDKAEDGHGHGTHVAGTVAGSSYGVAKAAKIVAVRVLDNTGTGPTSGIIAGVDWVTANAVKPAVANMSLGGGISTALDTAVRNSIASGVTYALAAGNDNIDAAGSSPARVTEALTVGSTTSGDARSSFSNYGSTVDIFAPGSAITSAWNTGDTATNTINGTSMASPHVAGAAALYLADNPTATPSQVAEALISSATNGVVTTPGTGSPNRLLNVEAFRSGPRGIVTGTVTDGTAPLAEAKVTVGDVTAKTDKQGHYTLTAPPGTYDISASKFGYAGKTVSGVVIGDGQTMTENFALTVKPRVNVTGTVHDGSGQGWPLYATVRVKDEPTAVAYTDPKTGKYTLSVPVSDTYTLQVDPVYPGYERNSQAVQVGSADVTHDVNTSVDEATCSAAGYVHLSAGTCDPVPGGLVLGRVTDKNTGATINGATVTSADKPAEKTTSMATPNDPNLGDGFYWMFSSLTGKHTFSATAQNSYSPEDITVNVAPNQATDGTFALPAPRLAVSSAQLSKTVDWQGQASSTMTLKNTGTAPVTAQIGEQPGGYQPAAAQQGAPLQEVKPVPWLSVDKAGVTIQPGESVDVNVSFNANVAEITQPGTFTAELTIGAETPYGAIPSVPVALTVNPPKTWGKITGTVTGVDCTGTPALLRGVTVQITSKTASYTLKTDENGKYVLWLDVSNNPLTVIAAKDGWATQTRSVKVKQGMATMADFSLKPDHTCT
ncbi:hypothetical protein GCM10020367_56100 [Streptomyces sannanensis]|uniref:Uncharacterized protein n=1 Tax=Streptomyces sannanensis TaxID=285536 RepID=A0ABP6SJP4_9ACTN